MNDYRCETCKKPHRVPNGLSRFPIFECCGDEMPFDIAISTGMRGCASHSDFQSEIELQCKRVSEKLIFHRCDNCCDKCIFCDNAGGCLAESYKNLTTIRNDQALDKLHKWFDNYCEGNEEAELWMAFLHAERALRKSKDGE